MPCTIMLDLSSRRHPICNIYVCKQVLLSTPVLFIVFLSISLVLILAEYYIVSIIFSCFFFLFMATWRLRPYTADIFHQVVSSIKNRKRDPYESVTKGLSKKQIARIPTKVLTQDSSESCIICLLPHCQNEQIRKLPCKHEFHADCIDIWVSKRPRCPMCKLDIIEPISNDAFDLI
mmetsp:Transcript_51035/g.81293  ORF Transcript_51035/g.81293 Transcript_51035/m.81293 type:complete len:176 (-) Transcript_51035:32-559(-)